MRIDNSDEQSFRIWVRSLDMLSIQRLSSYQATYDESKRHPRAPSSMTQHRTIWTITIPNFMSLRNFHSIEQASDDEHLYPKPQSLSARQTCKRFYCDGAHVVGCHSMICSHDRRVDTW